VAAAGHSAGGGVTARLACELAGRVAAVAAVAPALFTEPVECRPSRAVPLLAVHGTADEVLPYGGQGASVASPLPPCRLYPPGWPSGRPATAAPATRLSSSTPRR
jgi:polyhydroxybutyrate depolymerase